MKASDISKIKAEVCEERPVESERNCSSRSRKKSWISLIVSPIYLYQQFLSHCPCRHIVLFPVVVNVHRNTEQSLVQSCP